MSRPALHKEITADIFDSYYWYKDELTEFAKSLGLSGVGGKFEIHDRISHFLRTGEKLRPLIHSYNSTFNWAKEELTLDTVITDSYKNNQNVRAFFKKHLGESFSFNIDLMKFMKTNIGSTLEDAVIYYQNRSKSIKDDGYIPEIPDHNQYNLYVRQFMEDNPEKTRENAFTCWKAYIEIPQPGGKGRGYEYSREHLKFL